MAPLTLAEFTAGSVPAWRFYPTPERLARLMESCLKDPDWSREALEEWVLALRMRMAPEFDEETVIREFRAMMEKHLPKKE